MAVTRLPGAPPTRPPDLHEVLVDEGPMRRELLRQIAQLDLERTMLLIAVRPWDRTRTTPRRGPALLDTPVLEQIRDELLGSIAELQRVAADEG